MENNIGFLISIVPPKTEDGLGFLVLGRIKGVVFASLEGGHSSMLGDPIVEELLKLFALHSILLVVPSQLLEIKINEVIEVLFFGVDATYYEHVSSQQSSSMASSGLHTVLVMHLQASNPIVEHVHQKYCVVAIP